MNGIIRGLIPGVLCLSLGLGASAAFAKNQCKGMSNPACTADESCTWVKGYITKSGNKVDPYCRVKAKKKQASEKTGPKEKAKNTDKAKGTDKGKKTKKSENADTDKKMKEKEKKETKTQDK